MLNEIRRLINQRPFVPFVVHLTNGLKLPVPTVDHVAFSPSGLQVVVFENDGTANVLSGLHITNVSFNTEAAEQASSPI